MSKDNLVEVFHFFFFNLSICLRLNTFYLMLIQAKPTAYLLNMKDNFSGVMNTS